jgi:ribosomal protein L11 methyltransferase
MIRLAVRCRPEQAELVLAELAALAPNGFEEERGDGYVEYAVYGAEGELPDLGEVEAAAGEGLVEVEATAIPDDWADRWQDFHQPLLVGGRVWVRPSWAKPHPEAIDVVIEPGRAFGTEGGGALTDLGTGSGVLAIAAAKLGWKPVSACDQEPAALQEAARNAAANSVELEPVRANLRQELPALAPTVVANLTAPLLRQVAARLRSRQTPRILVCSGLLAEEADDVTAAFAPTGLVVRKRRVEGDWASISFAAR